MVYLYSWHPPSRSPWNVFFRKQVSLSLPRTVYRITLTCPLRLPRELRSRCQLRNEIRVNKKLVYVCHCRCSRHVSDVLNVRMANSPRKEIEHYARDITRRFIRQINDPFWIIAGRVSRVNITRMIRRFAFSIFQAQHAEGSPRRGDIDLNPKLNQPVRVNSPRREQTETSPLPFRNYRLLSPFCSFASWMDYRASVRR